MIQEDKLRISPRNVLHHQIMAEVTVKDFLEYNWVKILNKQAIFTKKEQQLVQIKGY